MRFFPTLVFFLIFGCVDNDPQTVNEPLKGKINGEVWEGGGGNAYIYSSDGKYTLRLLSSNESSTDACTAFSPRKAHIAMVLIPEIGSYSFPLPIVPESAKFVVLSGNELLGTSGYLEIYGVRNASIYGYMQLVLDDENTVEGTFIVDICN